MVLVSQARVDQVWHSSSPPSTDIRPFPYRKIDKLNFCLTPAHISPSCGTLIEY